MSMQPGRERLASIDVLRGFAAMTVLLLHVPHRLPNADLAPDWRYWLLLPIEIGQVRTTLFLLLSGFCIHLITLHDGERRGVALACDAVGFWKRRFTRLYLPYLVVVLLWGAALVPLYFLNLSPTCQFDDLGRHGRDVTAHLFLVHNMLPDYVIGMHNGPLWALGMEMQ